MSLSRIYTRAQFGIDAPAVTVETHLSNGLPSLSIVGLPETAVRESKERVRSALLNSGYEFPCRRVTINLAPADLPKQGGRYDLAIAVGILAATGQLESANTEACEFVGELALDGSLRPIPGALPCALAASAQERAVFLPVSNVEEAIFCKNARVFGAKHLNQICKHLLGAELIEPQRFFTPTSRLPGNADLAEVRGQFKARRALELAAAGGHNLLFYGPPGSGKSMLASRLPGILPNLHHDAALEVASVYSLAGKNRPIDQLYLPPFRSPHHSASSAALVGGGTHPTPGEISLAHHGILFLDELPEFGRPVLEVLREPIESGEIHISRAASTLTFPARFQLLAAMNPCPCGYLGHPKIECTDTPQQIANYRRKLSGPLLDRFDLHVEVGYQPAADLFAGRQPSESSADVAARVLEARARQLDRQKMLNASLQIRDIEKYCALEQGCRILLENAMDKLALSARGAHRIIRVARTLADLDGEPGIQTAHMAEAISYRGLERKH